MQAIRHLLVTETAAIETDSEAFLQYNAELDEALSRCIWSHKGMTTYYRNDAGRIVVSSPWKYVDYWARLREFSVDDYQAVEVPATSAAFGESA
jgi:4-hydroxyacetophenone monooxygenase